jgi:hypothetical protein
MAVNLAISRLSLISHALMMLGKGGMRLLEFDLLVRISLFSPSGVPIPE